jgi:hypothetical protein
MKKYEIKPESINHVQLHFTPSANSGSCFNSKVFINYSDVINYINKTIPFEKHKQSNGREVHVFRLLDNVIAGFQGIATLSELGNVKIETENRNGFEVRFVKVEEFKETSLFCVIVENHQSNYNIVTMFPGCYAPPFPYNELNNEEFAFAVKFWESHVLLKP